MKFRNPPQTATSTLVKVPLQEMCLKGPPKCGKPGKNLHADDEVGFINAKLPREVFRDNDGRCFVGKTSSLCCVQNHHRSSSLKGLATSGLGVTFSSGKLSGTESFCEHIHVVLVFLALIRLLYNMMTLEANSEYSSALIQRSSI